MKYDTRSMRSVLRDLRPDQFLSKTEETILDKTVSGYKYEVRRKSEYGSFIEYLVDIRNDDLQDN